MPEPGVSMRAARKLPGFNLTLAARRPRRPSGAPGLGQGDATHRGIAPDHRRGGRASGGTGPAARASATPTAAGSGADLRHHAGSTRQPHHGAGRARRAR
jgi:hypothetical protein